MKSRPAETAAARFARLPVIIAAVLGIAGTFGAATLAVHPLAALQADPCDGHVLLSLALLGFALYARAVGTSVRWGDAAALAALLVGLPPIAQLAGDGISGGGPWQLLAVGTLSMSPHAPATCSTSGSTSIALLLGGLYLLLLPRVAAERAVFISLFLLVVLFAVSLVGTLFQLPGIVLSSPWSGRSDIGQAVEPLLMLLAIGLFRTSLGMESIAAPFRERPDRTVFVVSSVALLVVLLMGAFLARGALAPIIGGTAHPGDAAARELLAVTLLGGVVAVAGAAFIHRHVRPLVRGLAWTQKMLNRAQTVAQMGSWHVDVHSGELTWTDETYRLFGVPKGTRLDYGLFLELVHPEDRAKVDAAWKAALGGAGYDVEHRLASEPSRWVRERAEFEMDRHGLLVNVIGTVEDITERRTRETELLHSRQKLRELAAHHEKELEAERAHIAREMHDEMGQHLTALRLEVALLQVAYADTDSHLAARLGAMKRLIDELVMDVRHVASRLRPTALNFGLASAAEWLVNDFIARSGIACRLVLPPAGIVLDDARATVVFRILQESLTNIIRHAGASAVEIRLGLQDDVLRVEVQDDGRGFDPAEVREKNTFGLMGIRERALMFGGSSHFVNPPGGGALLQVDIPIKEDSA